jgi:hypothetical protein
VNGLDPSLEAPGGNNTFDWVPLIAAVPTSAYPTRNVVTTAAFIKRASKTAAA